MGIYLSQLKALIKRNILIKKATKSQTMMEIFFPILMIFMTYFLNKVSETKKYNPVGPTETLDLNIVFSAGSTFFPDNSAIGFILPPNNPDKNIINKVMENDIFLNSKIQPIHFNNTNQMTDYNNDYHNTLLAGVIFESDDYLHYTIRVNATSAPKPTDDPITNYAISRYKAENFQMTDADKYMVLYSPLQAAVDQAIIQTQTKDDTFKMNHSIGKLGKPYSEYSSDSNGGTFATYISIIYMIPIIVIVVSIVQEKEKGIRDGLLTAGIHPTVFWLSWLIIYIIVSFIISLIITVFFRFTHTFTNCNSIILFVALFLYGVSCCSLAFIFSTMFKKTKTAGTVVSLLMVVFSYSNFASEYINLAVKKILSIFISPLAVGTFIYEVDKMENHFQNLDFGNLFSSTPGFFLLLLVINNILYFVLALVFDNLLSNETARYLFRSKRTAQELHEEGEVTYNQDIQEDFNARNGERCVVEVSHVHKVFQRKKGDETNSEEENQSKKNSKNKKKDSEFLAVNDVSFKVYENEIFAILGHNGAGKTTLINIMVGLLKATDGTVFFDGRNINTDTNDIRKGFGVCAQTNIIYDELTVEDHIKFYAGLKDVEVDVDAVLREIDLISHKTTKAAKLSGGQKRKLCIGMATIGNPKYIFLDEPTTGLDPLSRRKIWELLSKKKKGRVIFLTTHYMDEADILADRKLILTKGKIRCLGTSLFLKNHFNMNYNLDVETENSQQVNDIIQRHLPEATYVFEKNENASENNKEKEKQLVHTWRLPLNTTNRFSDLMNELESQTENIKETSDITKNENGIANEKQQNHGFLIKKFALSMPTLEELFIRLEDNTIDEDSVDSTQEEEQCLIQTNDDRLPKLQPIETPSRLSLLKNLIKYRIKIFLKDKGFAFYNVIFPVITTVITFIFINKIFNNEPTVSESRVISLSETYSDALLNLEPNQTLGITPEHLQKIHKNPELIKTLPLKEIGNPSITDPYYIASIDGQMAQNHYSMNIHYNDSMTHALPATLNALSNSILASKDITNPIITKSQPFDENNDMLAIIGLSIAGFIIGYCVVGDIGKFGPLIVRERVNQLLQQLQLNGVSRINYWISCFISDNSIFIFSCILMFIAGVVVQFKPLMDIKILVIIFILLILWSMPTMLYQYVVSFLFNKEETAYSIMGLINTYSVMFGFLIFMFISISTLSNTESVIENLSEGFFTTKTILYNMAVTTFFPAYGIVAMVNALFTLKIYEQLINYDINLTNLLKFHNGITPVAAVLIVLSFVLFFLLIYLDKHKNQTNASDIHELPKSTREKYESIIATGDDDVAQEFRYVKDHQKELPVSVLHLSKEYPAKVPRDKENKAEFLARDPENFKFGDIHPSLFNANKLVKTAVIDVNFGVRNHECFGLLGPNGAGKSTTLNTVTSTIPQTTGQVSFHGVETHVARLGEISMGYCPQNDILWKELTLREHLEFFLCIRGYNSADAKEYATQYINCVGLEEHQNKRVEKLSGGTKRKLSLLIAICGYPKQILLDEPTAGMDPSTRRMVWNIIKKTKSMNDSALIMTTHSMEEAENLCDRLAILVNGRLTCIGSPEHLKMKFGEGYILEIQSKETERFHQEIIEQGRLFGNKEYTMEKSSSERRKYVVKMTRNIGHVFEVMEQCKKRGLVTDYSFNQTSLEQIFINFAKEQVLDQDANTDGN